MMPKISSVMFSAAAGISQMVVIHALGNIIGLIEMKTDIFKNINPSIFLAAVLVLLGLSYFFMKLVTNSKFSYFLGALLLEIVFFIVIVAGSVSSLSANALSVITVYLIYAFIPILILDALIIIVSAIVKSMKSNKAEEVQNPKARNDEVQIKDTQKAVVQDKKNYYCLIAAALAAGALILSYNLLSGIEFMMLLPLPGIAYFYFQTKCDKQWIYTLVFIGAFVIGTAAAWIFFSNPFLNNEGIMSVSAAVTLLITDLIALAIKKRLKN